MAPSQRIDHGKRSSWCATNTTSQLILLTLLIATSWPRRLSMSGRLLHLRYASLLLPNQARVPILGGFGIVTVEPSIHSGLRVELVSRRDEINLNIMGPLNPVDLVSIYVRSYSVPPDNATMHHVLRSFLHEWPDEEVQKIGDRRMSERLVRKYVLFRLPDKNDAGAGTEGGWKMVITFVQIDTERSDGIWRRIGLTG